MKRCSWLDYALLAGLTVVSVASNVIVARMLPGHPDAWVIWMMLALQVAATPVLLWRVDHPVRTGLVIVGSGLLQVTAVATAAPDLAELLVSLDVWLPVALSTAVTVLEERNVPTADRRPFWALLALVTLIAARPWAPDLGIAVNGLLHTAVAALVGLYLATRRRLMRELVDRAERAEREQHLLAAQARADERTRLAAEMHDVVAHRVTLMVLQAGALAVQTRDGDQRAAVEELRHNGTRALDELRDLIGVLRHDGLVGDTAPTRISPSPALSTLVDESDRIGLPVALVEDGDAGRLSPVVGRAAHRVVQEALTNARKHAWGSTVSVHARYGEDEVTVSVHNTAGSGPQAALADSGSGTGLAGLRERVELVGGSLTAGPGPDGGFTVEARMPTRVAA